MSKVYFGKFDSRRPHQIQEKYYAAGAKESTWYGGIEPGDFVFVVTNANVIALWKVREYGHKVILLIRRMCFASRKCLDLQPKVPNPLASIEAT
jgi:5-methylcytosine-specific restriction protein B